METPIIVAIISGTVAFVSPIVTVLVNRKLDQKKLGKIKGFRKSIIGDWKGQFNKYVNGSELKIGIRMSFTVKNKKIEGSGEFLNQETEEVIKIRLIGCYCYSTYINHDY